MLRSDMARRLVDRLERLSADSYWAHQASGIRGSLVKTLERIDQDGGDPFLLTNRLQQLNDAGFAILVKAARSQVFRNEWSAAVYATAALLYIYFIPILSEHAQPHIRYPA